MEWKTSTDSQGRVYYYNAEGKVQWEPPTAEVPEKVVVEVFAGGAGAAPQETAPPVLPPGWSSAKDADGKSYYYCHSSGLTSWTFPTVPGNASSPPQPAMQPAAASTTTTTVVTIINNSTSSNAVHTSGFIDLCGCCGNCEWVQVTVDEERVETLREERGCCTCSPPQKVEAVEFSHLLSARGVEGWVSNPFLIFLGVFFGILRESSGSAPYFYTPFAFVIQRALL